MRQACRTAAPRPRRLSGGVVSAALLVASVRAEPAARPPRKPGSTLRAEIAEGLDALGRDRVLRGLCAATTLCTIGMGALIATLVPHITGRLGAGSAGYAAAILGYGAGSVLGGLPARRLAERTGRIRAILLAGTVQLVALVVLGTVRDLWAAIACLTVFGVSGMVWNVNRTTLTQERSPAPALGRISAAFRTLAVAGALLGGAAAACWGPNAPALVAAAFFMPAVASPARLIN